MWKPASRYWYSCLAFYVFRVFTFGLDQLPSSISRELQLAISTAGQQFLTFEAPTTS